MTDIFSPADAMAKAATVAGLNDFGPEGFREGLEKSLSAFANMPLTPEAREAVNERVTRELATRLQIEQWYRDHPETGAQQIEGPVFVVGAPRTGTTATVAMLALDTRFRALRAWEANAPVPPPVAGEEEGDSRVIAAREAAQHYDRAHLHLSDPDGPEEDLALLSGLDMHSFHGSYPMPDAYLDWWMAEDFRSTYAYHERILKMLQSRRPPYLWLLKSPPHIFRLRTITQRYPNAKFVVTHRDPLKFIPSIMSLYSLLHEERCLPGSLDKFTVCRRILNFWTIGVQRCLADRAVLGENRFVDVWNDDLVKKPIEVIEQIYAHIGVPMQSSMRQQIKDYSTQNAPGTFGNHKYTVEEFGLTKNVIRDAFADYIERFDF